jgi:hypothetical protein
MKQFLQISFVVVILVALASASVGGNLEDGIEAAESGDFKKAYKLYLSEARQGNTSAQAKLGVLYAIGLGVQKDVKEATKWYRMAAEKGDAKAQNNLGIHFAIGLGVPQDDREAAKWFSLAAKQGDAKSQLSLGIMYDVGRGVSQNHVVAWAWYALAEENGEEAAQGYLDAVQKTMTPTEINMAQQIAELIRAEAGE